MSNETRQVIVEADGGSRGNPGTAGYGAVVRAADTGVVIAKCLGGLGITTNNVAEYQGLIAGLRAAAELGAQVVTVRMDSKLVVEQMSGRWQVKHAAMQALAAEARNVASQFETVTYEWIPRVLNKDADQLANQAMDEQRDISLDHRERQESRQLSLSLKERGKPTRFYLVRHAETELCQAGRYSGRSNVPLTDSGKQHAKAIADRLSSIGQSAAIFSSPLDRSKATAAEIAATLRGEVTVDERLISTDIGSWEGLTFAEAAERDPELHRQWLVDASVSAPGGESRKQVADRTLRFRDDVLAEYPEQSVVVVSHTAVIQSLLRLGLNAGPSLYFRLKIDPTSLSIVDFYTDGHAQIGLINETTHIPPADLL